EGLRSEHGGRSRTRKHRAEMLDIAFPSGEGRGGRQRHGYEARILAGEERAHEPGTGLGHHRHALARGEAGAEHPPAHGHRLFPQIAIGQDFDELVASRVEIEAGSAERRIIERLGQCRKLRRTELTARNTRWLSPYRHASLSSPSRSIARFEPKSNGWIAAVAQAGLMAARSHTTIAMPGAEAVPTEAEAPFGTVRRVGLDPRVQVAR